jgi:hypothetical protein
MFGLSEIPEDVRCLFFVNECVASILYRNVYVLLELDTKLTHTNESNETLLGLPIYICAVDTHLKLTTD